MSRDIKWDFTNITGYEHTESEFPGYIAVERFGETKKLIKANGIGFHMNSNPPVVYSRLGKKARDPEHDRAYCFNFHVVGLEFQRLRNGSAIFEGHIQPENATPYCNGAGRFRVPPPDFDPFEEAKECTKERCEPHPIVGYVQEHDDELYQKVEGLKATILIPTC